MIKIIKEYLAQHKRLVIPQLGSFIVKADGGGVVFSEMMRRDDGVLRSLITARGASELEAAGEIDRFVFEVRHAIEAGEVYPLEGFGVMCPGANSTITFRYDSSVGENTKSGMPAATVPKRPVAAPMPRPAVRPVDKPVEKPADKSAAATSAASADVAPAESVVRSEPAAPQSHLTDSVKMNPDPSVKGLRYGKPPKSTNAYTYVDEPPRRTSALGDIFIWVGIVVAAIALSAIAYGYWRDVQDKRAADEYFEEIASEQSVVEEFNTDQNQ